MPEVPLNVRDVVIEELGDLDIFINGAIRGVILDLAEPLNIVELNIRERNRVPRNLNYYEETIPLYPGDLFSAHFRMSRNCFEELLNIVHHQGVEAREVPIAKKLLFTIWVLAKPESFLSVGDRFGLAPSTAHAAFKEIINVLVALMNPYISWPNNHEEAVRQFEHKSQGITGVIGAIDGCHIPIKQPSHNRNDYYNRKHFHSIILQGVCNHTGMFMDITVGMPGRVHDARVLRNSPLYARLTDNVNPLLPQNLHLIGDSAYPLMQNLLTPFRDNGHLNAVQQLYNARFALIRGVIERAFARLKGKYRRLKYLDISEPEFGTAIITAACVLHNFTLRYDDDDECAGDDDEGLIEENDIRHEDNIDIGFQKRLDIANRLIV